MSVFLEELRRFIAARIREGFDSDDAIIDGATDYATAEGHEDLEAEIESITAELSAAHREEQATWIDPTDCSRLDSAFAHLEECGIIARQNFSCCGTCGPVEMGYEIQQAEELNREVQGYVFYHMQDTEGAAETGHLYLAYGAVEQGEELVAKVGEIVVRELKAVGLETEWNGRPDQRISVVGMKWQRRR